MASLKCPAIGFPIHLTAPLVEPGMLCIHLGAGIHVNVHHITFSGLYSTHESFNGDCTAEVTMSVHKVFTVLGKYTYSVYKTPVTGDFIDWRVPCLF